MTDKTDKPVILIVDDEADLREAIVFDFERNGFTVLCAENGAEAIKIVQSTPIDLVLSDVRMPGGDGVELLKNIRNHSIEIPIVIFLTGFSDMTLEDAYNTGANAVLSKPFDRKALLATVRKSLASKAERWQVRTQGKEATFSINASKILNLGQGGMYIHLTGALPQVLEKVKFTISIDSTRPPLLLEGTGIVRWVRPQDSDTEKRGCGIEFEELNDSCRARLIEIIQSLGAKAYIPKS